MSQSKALAASNAASKIERVRHLLDQDEEWSLAQLAQAVELSASYLQRQFVARFGLSPAEYAAQRKLGQLKSSLREGKEVSHALYAAGYGSPSRIYEDGARKLGMTPARYRDGGKGICIRWAWVETALGPALVAATERGICAVELGNNPTTLEANLRKEFSRAQIERVDEGCDEFLAPRLRAVAERLAGRVTEVSLDLMGTAFQQRVWEALMKIPSGQTRSYAELANAISAPRAARAVATACASNRIAVVVPCHRIIRGDGSLGGYRWGLPMKQALLIREQAASA